MFQSICVALVLFAAMAETAGLYQWSRHAGSQGLQQNQAIYVAQADRQLGR